MTATHMERRLVCTLAIGDEFEALGAITHPFQRAYADAVSADFRVMGKIAGQTGVPGLEKLQLVEFLEHYDRILFLDTDILVVPGADDVFATVAVGEFGATVVYGDGYPRVPVASRIEKDMAVALKLFRGNHWTGPYFNSGVMVLDRSHRQALHRARDRASQWAVAEGRLFMDQTLLNYCVWEAGIALNDLGFRFNHTPAFGKSAERFRSHFVHYAGRRGHRKGARIRQIALDARVMRHSTALRLAQRVTGLVSLADRL